MYPVNTVRIHDFVATLEKHKFAFMANSPEEYRYALKRDFSLIRTALNSDPRFVDALVNAQKAALEKMNKGNTEKNGISLKPSRELIHIGNFKPIDFDQKERDSAEKLKDLITLNAKIKAFDWDYNKQQPRERYLKGKRQLEEILQLVENGEAYMKVTWELACRRNNFTPKVFQRS